MMVGYDRKERKRMEKLISELELTARLFSHDQKIWRLIVNFRNLLLKESGILL